MPSRKPLASCLMVQGSASGVGKSVVATALCRVLHDEGRAVAPFKAQNMSNNAAVTLDGGEIGRAQAAQAEAAGIEPSAEMNPILLKPEAEDRSQLVVRGRAVGSYAAREYWAHRGELWPVVRDSLRTLRETYDVVVIEGAGSPAELNLRDDDLANMRIARHAGARVLLVGDIERGGIFAQLLGTLDLLRANERRLVRGLLVNKFRGDPALFEDGTRMLERRSRLPVVGVLPYHPRLGVPAEDSQSLDEHREVAGFTGPEIALIAYPRISNFDDLDPLRGAGAQVRVVRSPADLRLPDLIVLPGSKATIADLAWLRASGLAAAILRAAAHGIAILGICGGYQMLGERVEDPEGIEGPSAASAEGLGLLPVRTYLTSPKLTRRVRGAIVTDSLLGLRGTPIAGYEIHSGVSQLAASGRAFATLEDGPTASGGDGAVSEDGLVVGTGVHGVFAKGPLAGQMVAALSERRGVTAVADGPDKDRLSHWFRKSADVPRIMSWL